MDLQTYLTAILRFINSAIVPFILAIAFFVFLWNAMRYFIVGGGSEESQEKARSLATWGITAFVVIISFWGIVNFLVAVFGFGNPSPVTPDYIQSKG